MTRYAVYTSVFGSFEELWPPLDTSQGLTKLVVSDNAVTTPGWSTTATQPTLEKSPRLSNRKAKTLHHENLEDFEASLYIDANVRPMGDLNVIFRTLMESGADLAMYPHYARSSVRAEAEACIRRNKVEHPERVAEELALYAERGFPDKSGVWEGSVIFKNHSSPKLSGAMHEWWELYSRFQTRDQFSLPFVIWKHGLTVLNLDTLAHPREHYFHRVQHSSSGFANRTARYLQARAPENRMWAGLHRISQLIPGSP